MKLLSSSSRSALVGLLTITLAPSHVVGGGPAPTTTPSPALGGVATPTEVPSLVSKFSACALTPNWIVSLTSEATCTITSTPASTPLQCNEDNCFRQLIRSSALAAPFCNAYIPTPSTCTTGLPAHVSQCSTIPARISSACSCLAAKQTDLPSSSTRNNVTKGRFSATFSESVVQVTESESVSIVTATGSGLASLTQPGPPKYTASLSTLTEDDSMVPRPLPHPTQTSSFTFGPSGVGSLTQPGSSSHSTQVAAAPTSSQKITTWASFPPTDAMKSCLTIDACKRAAYAFSRCMDDRYDDTTSWNCFCETNFQTWRDVARKCSSCITDALPTSTTYNVSDVILAGNFVLDKFCNVTDTNVKAKSRSALVKMGNSLTTYFESPIAFYNFTLLDAPIGDPLQSTVLALASASMTAKLGQPTQTVFFEVWITSTLPRSTSPPTPTPTKWASVPISPALRACQEGSSCYNAGAVFKDCIGKGTALNNTATWHCLCHTKFIFWDAALDSCLFCIASSLLPQNSTHAPWAPKRMLDVKRVLINENYCKADQSAASINRTTPWLIDAGFDATVIFESPGLLWNMTVLKDGLGVDQRVLDPIISAVNVGVATSALQVGKSTATAVATPAAAEF